MVWSASQFAAKLQIFAVGIRGGTRGGARGVTRGGTWSGNIGNIGGTRGWSPNSLFIDYF